MSGLEHICTELQHIVEAIHAVTSIDITVVDDRLVRVAGTGPLAGEIGRSAPRNSAFHKCLQSGQTYFIRNPREDELCLGCAGRTSCHELAELCLPIKSEGQTIGVLGMCAFDAEAEQHFTRNHEDFLRFENQLSTLISAVLGERRYGTLAEYRSSELSALINSVNEGILVLSADATIITVNRYLTERLGIDPDHPPTLAEALTPAVSERLIAREFSCETGPVRLGESQYLISASPIRVREECHGAVLVFSDFEKMQRSVLRASRSTARASFEDILGESPALCAARDQARLVAGTDVPVVLIGETGTGKEVFARAIHAASRRRGDVLMPLNCGSIPETLIESELFGYEKGAFTGASAAGKLGLFEMCKSGTLLLDEIGDLALSVQVKLLRALEEKEIMRVGGTTPLRVNPRVISASHRDLRAMVAQQSFREDLYYRLNVVSIVIPPLRERGNDVLLLARRFVQRFAGEYGKPLDGLSRACEQLLLRYPFPGNIRELRNLIEYAVIFETGSEISAETIAPKLEPGRIAPAGRSLAAMTRGYERMLIKQCLHRQGDSLEAKREVALQLGISLTTLYRKLEEQDEDQGPPQP